MTLPFPARPTRFVRLLTILSVVTFLSACDVNDAPSVQESGGRNSLELDLKQFDIATGSNVIGDDVAPIGGCVHMGGSPSQPSFETVSCDAAEANYRVVQRVNLPNECVPDVDRRYYRNTQGEEFTACLDYAWHDASCISMIKPIPQKVSCNDTSAPDRERPVQVVTNVINVASCPSGGFSHPVRRFTVCTEAQK